MRGVRRFFFIVLWGTLSAQSIHSATSSGSHEESTINPSLTCYATRGLTQVSSAEALGAGRFSVGLQGAWFQQKREFENAPDSGASIITGIGAISFGINPYMDIFGSIAAFGSAGYTSTTKGGVLRTAPAIQSVDSLDNKGVFSSNVPHLHCGRSRQAAVCAPSRGTRTT